MFSQQVTEFIPQLRPYAIKLTQNLDDTDDLIQETVYKALSNEDKFREGTNLKAWLFTIMKNIFINNYRKKVKRSTIIDTTENLYYINSARTVVNKAESSMVKDKIMMAIRKLSIEYRVPFMLHYKGYKYHEIADRLNLPLGTVKSRIFFARKELKEVLNAYR